MTAFSKRYTKLQNFSLLEAIAESGCVVEGVKVLCAIVIYLTSSCVILAFFGMSGPV
jgi:hypothetical protein